MSYDTGIVPAPPQVAPGHPRLVDGPTLRREGLTLKSSIGMGGHNSAIVLADA
jgi:3-oxoacyl-[acyl-carrier-protein] synthase II